MARANKKSELLRLEDLIDLAKKGQMIELEIKLRKQTMIQKVDFYSAESGGDIDTYLLIADYSFKLDGQMRTISKVYMFAAATDAKEETKTNANIANFRLQVDYGRLRAADIVFTEKFF